MDRRDALKIMGAGLAATIMMNIAPHTCSHPEISLNEIKRANKQ